MTRKTLDRSQQYELSFSHLNEKQRDAVKRRVHYIEAVQQANVRLEKESLEPLILKISTSLNENAPSWISVYRWMTTYQRSNRDPLSLVPYPPSHRKRPTKLHPEVDKIVEEVINEVYLTKQKNSAKEVWKQVRFRISVYNNHNSKTSLKAPSYPTICNRINKLGDFDKTVAREGYNVARVKYRSSYGGQNTARLLERVEIDHTQLDIFVVEDETGEVAGRPTLTTAIDCCSRSLLGFYVSFEPPSYLSVAECLKSVLLPKDWLKERYPIVENEWYCFGLPEHIIVDNGKEMHSKHLSDACLLLGIKITHNPPRTPWLKGQVERYFRTLNQGIIHKQPGSTKGYKRYPHGFNPAKDACIPFSLLMSMLHVWVIDVYHHRVHRTLQCTPYQDWKRHGAAEIRLPHRSSEEITLALCRNEERMLSHKGVEYAGLFYNSPALMKLFRQTGKHRVSIKVDPNDISWIAVFDSVEQRYLKVVANQFGYAQGKTLWQHKVIRRFHKESGNRDSSGLSLAHAEQKLTDMMNAASSGKRKGLHTQRKSRLKGIGTTHSHSPKVEEEISIVSEEMYTEDDTAEFYKPKEGWTIGYLDD